MDCDLKIDECKEPIYKMTLELAQGKTEIIEIFLDSIPEELAYEFCKNKNLDMNAMNYLIEEINVLMKKFPKREVTKIKTYSNTESEEIKNEGDKLNNLVCKTRVSNKLINASNIYNKFNNSRSAMKNNHSNTPIGERLYNKGMKLREETNKKINEIKNKINEENSNNYTHSPNLKKSNEIFHSENKINHDIILNYNAYQKERLEKLKIKHQDNVHFSFSPEINYRSRRIMSDRYDPTLSTTSNNNFDRLYGNKKESSFNGLSNHFYRVFKYKPIVNHNPNINATFEERQMNFLKRKEENKERIMNKLANSGETFSTRLKNSDRSLTSNIYNFLNSNTYRYDSNRTNKEINSEKDINKSINHRFLSNDTDNIFNKKKQQVFKKIFKLLDSDNDGLLSVYNMNVKKLSSSIICILEPIFKEMVDKGVTLNEDEFIQASHNLYNMLTYDEKRTILNYNKEERSNKVYMNYSFKPVINNNSRKIAHKFARTLTS